MDGTVCTICFDVAFTYRDCEIHQLGLAPRLCDNCFVVAQSIFKVAVEAIKPPKPYRVQN